MIPVELMYWQAPLRHVAPDGETFSLINQSAQGMHRAAFAKDLMRVEDIVATHGAAQGWVLSLNNDASCWNAGRGDSTHRPAAT